MKTLAEITFIKEGQSKHGGSYRMFCFKDLLGGKSAITYIYEGCRNKIRWQGLKVGDKITNHIFKRPGLIDADSQFTKVA